MATKKTGENRIVCDCGGEIELYADALGTCKRCKNDFLVKYSARGNERRGKRSLVMLKDHRRDLL